MGGNVGAGRSRSVTNGAKRAAKTALVLAALTFGTGWSVKPYVDAVTGLFSATGAGAENPAQRVIRDPLYGVDMVSDSVGVAVGYYGSVLTTENGGKDWTHGRAGDGELLRRVHAHSATAMWATGHRGSIFHSSDGGRSWNAQRASDGVYLRDIAFANARTGWAVGHDARILKTSDGGLTWEPQELSGYSGRDLPRLHAVAVLSEAHAFLAGEFGIVARTLDGGANWQVLETPIDTTLTALAATTAGAVAVGLDGVALWIGPEDEPVASVLATGTDEHLFDIALNATGRGGAVGKAVLLSFDGQAFAPVDADPDLNLEFAWYHGADVLPNGELIAVGIHGSIIRFAPQNPAQMVVKSSAVAPLDVAARASAALGGVR